MAPASAKGKEIGNGIGRRTGAALGETRAAGMKDPAAGSDGGSELAAVAAAAVEVTVPSALRGTGAAAGSGGAKLQAAGKRTTATSKYLLHHRRCLSRSSQKLSE
eukprot:TRINITY_DN13103_c0_g1_i2.p2 TRINITY_DN13103_c0_g1~~TRINITY_DN13103_c0_g1_i2.p2  ORF type:complete len:105 (-),score=5.97 TRINITY_DN13103_c0_g1_i2:12-326(-)